MHVLNNLQFIEVCWPVFLETLCPPSKSKFLAGNLNAVPLVIEPPFQRCTLLHSRKRWLKPNSLHRTVPDETKTHTTLSAAASCHLIAFYTLVFTEEGPTMQSWCTLLPSAAGPVAVVSECGHRRHPGPAQDLPGVLSNNRTSQPVLSDTHTPG